MRTFLSVHDREILGQITMFDRMIFRGHLTGFYPQGAFQRFLSSQGRLLKDFGRYVCTMTTILREHMNGIATQAGRPMIYLKQAMTAARGKSKEALAREIATRDGVREGLICILSAVENCSSFEVRGNRQTQKLEVVRARRKCLYYYLYLMDREFGFMHIRLQSWFPFQIQIYINGREWLGRQMDRKAIGYRRYENSFLQIDRLEEARRMCERFLRRKWVRLLDGFARRVNPFLPLIRTAGFGGYWWVLDQAEIATDLMFANRAELSRLVPELFRHALTMFSSEDVLKFLGRKPHGNFQGEVTTDMKRRPEGYRVKHRVKGNSIKIYDKWSVLRVETTITQPREFKVLRVIKQPNGKPLRQWRPMGKSVANIQRCFQVGRQANGRYLEALAQVRLRGKAIQELEGLCRPVSKDGRPYAKLQPLSNLQRQVFAVLLCTDHVIHGVRNRDLRQALYGSAKPLSPEESRRRCARVSRMLRKLWAHGLIYRVRNARLYRVTRRGYRIMSSVLVFHKEEFAEAYARAS
jgi:hypothetical protein